MKPVWEDKRVVQVLPSGCMIWIGPLRNSGYGAYGRNGKSLMAHRVSYEDANGPIPAGLCVLHTCDVKTCINPDHLRVGTQRQNIQDAMIKGRLTIGSMNNQTRLTEAQVLEIKERLDKGERPNRIARDFPVSNVSISAIKMGKTWRHITNYARMTA